MSALRSVVYRSICLTLAHCGVLTKLYMKSIKKKSGFEYFASLPIKNAVENDQTAKNKIVLLHVNFFGSISLKFEGRINKNI